MKRAYLDYAASTPVDRRVLRAMEPYFSEQFGNPGSLHTFGQQAIAAVDSAREVIAQTIGAGFREVMFIGSATEANNLALRSAVSSFRKEYPEKRPKVVVSAIEHESVLETARDLERDGVEVAVLPVDREGCVNMKKLENELDERTAIVSVMYVNNEVGTVQSIAKIAERVKAIRGNRSYPLLHTDAAQAFHVLECNVEKLGVDLMTLSAHKMSGPKGVGALYVRGNGERTKIPNRSGYTLTPLLTGGGQEFGLRSGTENVPAIVGFGEAVRLASKARQKEYERLRALIARAWSDMRGIMPASRVNGVSPSSTKNRAPHILNVYIPVMSAEELLTRLDLLGISISSGSACASRSFEPSHVIQALGYTRERARNSVRISVGRQTTPAHIKQFVATFKKSLKTKI